MAELERLRKENAKLKDECLNENWFESLARAREAIAIWRQDYNEVRPHGTIGRIPPAAFAAKHRNPQQSTTEAGSVSLQTLGPFLQLIGMTGAGTSGGLPLGVGKTQLAVSLGLQAIEAGYRVPFTSAANLITQQGANLSFQLISRRYERGPMILTSKQSFGAWGEGFGDRVTATAILDRLLHHAVTLNVRGNSYSLKERLKAGLVRSDESDPQPGGEIGIPLTQKA